MMEGGDMVSANDHMVRTGFMSDVLAEQLPMPAQSLVAIQQPAMDDDLLISPVSALSILRRAGGLRDCRSSPAMTKNRAYAPPR
jgi:hypothetical protein